MTDRRGDVRTGEPDPRLQLREEDVVAGLCGGLTTRSIARECNMSVGTVRWYIHEIHQKLPEEYRRITPTRAIVIWAFKTKRVW